jgi:hypothetical protein
LSTPTAGAERERSPRTFAQVRAYRRTPWELGGSAAGPVGRETRVSLAGAAAGFGWPTVTLSLGATVRAGSGFVGPRRMKITAIATATTIAAAVMPATTRLNGDRLLGRSSGLAGK